MWLYHYYDASIGPFRNLSDISIDEANKILKDISIHKSDSQCAKRTAEYMSLRHYYEKILRNEFEKKGGVIQRKVPHYMVVEHSPWLATWYENSAYLNINVDDFDKRTYMER